MKKNVKNHLTPYKKIYLFSTLLIFLTLNANATITDESENYGKNKKKGLCLASTKSDVANLNSFSHITDLPTACPAYKELKTQYNKAKGKASGARFDFTGKSKTDSPAINNCIKRISEEYPSFDRFQKVVIQGDKLSYNDGDLQEIFKPSYRIIYERLKENVESRDDNSNGLKADFHKKCNEAADAAAMIAVTNEWNELCAYDSIEPALSGTYVTNGYEPYKQGTSRSEILLNIQKVFMDENREVKKCLAITEMTWPRYKGEAKSFKTLPNLSTFDNEITCVDVGGEALDYWDCEHFVLSYNYTELARVGGQGASQIITQNAQFEAQLNNDPNDPANMLRQQLKVLEGEKTAAQVETAALSARVVVLATFAELMGVNEQELFDKCTEGLNKHHPSGRSAKQPIPYLGAGRLLKNYRIEQDNGVACQYGYDAITLEPNMDNKNRARGLYVKAAAEAGIKGAQWHQAGKNMDLVNDAIDNIDAATEAVDVPDDMFTEMKVGPCAENPNSEECRSAGFTTGVSMVNPTINTGTTVRGVGEGELVKAEEDGDNNAVKNNEKPEDIAKSLSSSTFTDRRGKGGVKGAPRAARIQSGGSVGGDAGGGGGLGGGGASTGPAQGGGGGGPAPSTGAVSPSRKLKFNNNDSNLLSFRGGQGVGNGGRSKRKSRGNPLAALMGKKKGGSKTQRYARGTASLGRKSGNIFDQISSRYQDVKGKKRLIEYVPR